MQQGKLFNPGIFKLLRTPISQFRPMKGLEKTEMRKLFCFSFHSLALSCKDLFYDLQ